jgi:uncharacterized protein (DUF924 family)
LLSLLILLDQIPRNLYRSHDTLPYVYNHYDVLSQQLLKQSLTLNPRPDLDESLRHRPVLRMWLYLPLMHSESLEDHNKYLDLFQGMKHDSEERSDEEAVKFIDLNIDFEKRHHVIIEKFGRFPHRNPSLGRKTTDEEEKWLNEGGDRFGVGDS